MPIKLLPAMLANQIAAGEVVERPASVVKELIENSLDAGADKIDITIEKGGHKRILVRDNGKGVARQELTLALSRHATSKITSLDDLEQIISLGFRGEALASISSVSRLTLCSKPAEQATAWQAQAEGRDMDVTLSPAAHPDGTSIDVVDLFFNTPARRRFLRTEKTEFTNIDDVISRIALSRFDVQFTLEHNGKTLRRLPACQPDGQLKRVTQLLGKSFTQHCVSLSSEYEHMHLHGWVSLSEQANDHHYFYINGRMMRDKVVNHALRQACEACLPEQAIPGYVLYLDIDPNQVDVNVHPAKHEVRFHQPRLIHDFIYKAVSESLRQTQALYDAEQPDGDVPQPAVNHDYIRPLQSRGDTPAQVQQPAAGYQRHAPAKAANQRYQQLLQGNKTHSSGVQWMLAEGRYVLISAEQSWVMPLRTLHSERIAQLWQQQQWISQPLLIPISVAVDELQYKQIQARMAQWQAWGIDGQLTANKWLLRQVPVVLKDIDWNHAISLLIEADSQPGCQPLLNLLMQLEPRYSQAQAEQLWGWAEQHYAQQWPQFIEQHAIPLRLDDWVQQHG